MDMGMLSKYGWGSFALALVLLVIRGVAVLSGGYFFSILCLLVVVGGVLTNFENIIGGGMRTAGWVSFSIGFFLSAIAALNVPPSPTLKTLFPFVTGCIISVAGLILLRMENRYESKGQKRKSLSCTTEVQHGDITKPGYRFDPQITLNHIIYFLEKLSEKNTNEEIQEEIEKIQFYQIAPFVQNRYKLSDEMGLENFTHMFSFFATGERHLNRAWSAIVDNYKRESINSIKIALTNFKDALENLK